MATRRNLDTRSTARALHFTNAFTVLRVLACKVSAQESLPLKGTDREAYEELKRHGGTMHLYNKVTKLYPRKSYACESGWHTNCRKVNCDCHCHK